MTNRELSQVIRKDLKEHGITSKDVSVRVRDALYDTSVNITIKNPLIRETDVESMSKMWQRADRWRFLHKMWRTNEPKQWL